MYIQNGHHICKSCCIKRIEDYLDIELSFTVVFIYLDYLFIANKLFYCIHEDVGLYSILAFQEFCYV